MIKVHLKHKQTIVIYANFKYEFNLFVEIMHDLSKQNKLSVSKLMIFVVLLIIGVDLSKYINFWIKNTQFHK